MKNPQFIPTEEDREMSFEINALLAAMHQEDVETFHQILKDSDNHTLLLIGALATLKSICDTLVEGIAEADCINTVSFDQFILWTAEYLLDD